MTVRKLLAIDLGAESGRGVLGLFDGARIRMETVHRFVNGPVTLLDQMVWDAPGLHREVLNTIRKSAADFGGIDSIGVDTWGVDFGLIGADGALLGIPRHYRDSLTENAMDQAFRTMPREEIYRRTGLQFLRFNTLYQLVAMRRDRSPLVDAAKHLLMMPDLFHFWLTGIKTNETTNASTSQLLDARTQSWDYELSTRFGINSNLLGSLVHPGTVLGPLRRQVATDTSVNPVPVIAPATHDTASAVAAIPATGDDWAYLSSGTWSLLGVELPEPVINDASLAGNFTNEAGVNKTVRFLKNIMGLWLVQECKRGFAAMGVNDTYEELMHLANEAAPFRSLIDPDDPTFLMAADMPLAIGEFCRRFTQPTPDSSGAMIRCCLESLALKYRFVLERLESVIGRRINVLHVVGGGSQNALLNQWTADAINRRVIAGPVEATALGNAMMQAKGLGLVNSLTQIRDVVRQSFEPTMVEPREPSRWDEVYPRFLALLPA